jgi:hypothetical protein
MKRTLIVTAFLAMGLLVASSFAAAQEVTLPKPYFTGQATIGLLGASDVSSSKFTEYREVPQGFSVPSFNIAGSQKGIDFAFYGEKVRQTDQRFSGYSEFTWFGVAFDYNQTPHNMGNDGRVIFAETAPSVWSMSATLRKTLGDTVDAKLPATATVRNYDFYNNLLAPTFAAADSVDINSLRQTGTVAFDLGKNLPFDLAFTYMREVKTGNRGEGGGTLYGVVQSVVAVPDALNEVTQTSIRWAYKFKAETFGETSTRRTAATSTTTGWIRSSSTIRSGDRPGLYVGLGARRPGAGAPRHATRQPGRPRIVRVPAQVRPPDARGR